MTTKNNRIIVDLNKVQWANFYYVNQYAQRISVLPSGPTYRGTFVSLTLKACWLHEFPDETILERLVRRDMLDTWHPEIKLKLTANECLIYTGEKAKSLWDAWQAKIFGKTKKKKSNGNHSK